jgi:hypothetical protein
MGGPSSNIAALAVTVGCLSLLVLMAWLLDGPKGAEFAIILIGSGIACVILALAGAIMFGSASAVSKPILRNLLKALGAIVFLSGALPFLTWYIANGPNCETPGCVGD